MKMTVLSMPAAKTKSAVREQLAALTRLLHDGASAADIDALVESTLANGLIEGYADLPEEIYAIDEAGEPVWRMDRITL